MARHGPVAIVGSHPLFDSLSYRFLPLQAAFSQFLSMLYLSANDGRSRSRRSLEESRSAQTLAFFAVYQGCACLGIKNEGLSRVLALSAGSEVLECLITTMAHKGRVIGIRIEGAGAAKCVVEGALGEC